MAEPLRPPGDADFQRWLRDGTLSPGQVEAIRSDLGGGGLASLFWDMQTSGSPKPQLFKPDPAQSGLSGLVVSPAEKQAKIDQFLKG